MFLKTYLQALLNTRTTKSQASNASMPNFNASEIKTYETDSSVDSWIQIMNAVSPTDGYLVVNAECLTNNNQGLIYLSHLGINEGETAMGLVVSRESEDGLIRAFMPIAKGRGFQAVGSNLKNIQVKFLSTMGGGVKNIIWLVPDLLRRAFSWLRLSNYSNLGLSHTENGLRGRLRLGEEPLLRSKQLRQALPKLLGHLVMVGLPIPAMKMFIKSTFHTVHWEVLPQINTATARCISRVLKEKTFRSILNWWKELQGLLSLNFSEPEVQPFHLNLIKGACYAS